MNQTLMTQNDVIKYSGVAIPFNPCPFNELFNIEYEQARNCIGFQLWMDMIAATVDYSNVAEYTPGEYDLGDLVKFRGYIYEATELTTTAVPTVSTDWTFAPKFEGECEVTYNYIFCNFLAPYLAKTILHIRIPYIKTQITDVGVLEFNGEEFDTAEEESTVRLQVAIDRDARKIWNNFDHHMQMDAQKENDCLSGYLGYPQESCEANEKRKRKRVGGYRFG